MMNKISFVILIIVSVSVIKPQSGFTVMPYYMPISYDGSEYRENSRLMGVYGSWELDINNQIEAAVDYTNLKYVNDFELDQTDFTLVYSNYSVPEWIFRGGVHYISSEDDLTDKGYILFGGIGKYKFRSWDAMLNFYYSGYDSYFPSLKVIQLSPHLGLTFMLNSKSGVYIQSELNYIVLSKQLFFDSKNFLSVKETVTYFVNRFSVSVYGLFGEQAFAVRQQGFLIYNVAELYKTGFGGSLSYSFNRNSFVKVGVERDSFSDIALNNNANSIKLILAAGFNF